MLPRLKVMSNYRGVFSAAAVTSPMWIVSLVFFILSVVYLVVATVLLASYNSCVARAKSQQEKGNCQSMVPIFSVFFGLTAIFVVVALLILSKLNRSRTIFNDNELVCVVETTPLCCGCSTRIDTYPYGSIIRFHAVVIPNVSRVAH
jgi:ABC-type maltose transport system permease subunit